MRKAAIEDLKDGEEAIVFGTIEPAGATVQGPNGELCVYWEKREDLGSEASATGGQHFWIVDGDTRVLVPTDELADVTAKGDWTEEIVRLATSEIAAVSAELAELKDALRTQQSTELRRRRKKLAKVATLLCSIKAHARGKVHGRGTLESQARWIEKNRHIANDGPGQATIDKAVRRLLVVLSPGDPVSVSGRFRREPMPAGLGSGGGYRDRPTCWIVRGARVEGRQAASEAATPPPPSEPPQAQQPQAVEERLRGHTTFERAVLGSLSVVMVIAALLTIINRC